MDYGAQKVPQLQQLCKDRGLQTAGRKAELVERLEAHDASSKAAPAEDEIDWDDEPAADATKVTTNDDASKTDAAGISSEAKGAVSAPNQDSADSATVAEPIDATAPTADETEKKRKAEEEAAKFSTGLASRTLDEEIEKRKARARKFGLPEDSDEIKALERAKRFGGTDLPGLLNAALPEKSERKRGNGGEHDGGIRKKGRGRGPRGKASGVESEKPKTISRESGYPAWMTKQDREAAEKRKAKFASAT